MRKRYRSDLLKILTAINHVTTRHDHADAYSREDGPAIDRLVS